MIVQELRVPDLLWRDGSLLEGAKVLFCYLLTYSPEPQRLSYREMVRKTRISPNSVRKYLRELEANGWITWTRTSKDAITYQVIYRPGGDFIFLPTELLFDEYLPHGAKWVWGVIRRLGGPFDYQTLQSVTAYSRSSVAKYLHMLTERGWLSGERTWLHGKAHFTVKPVNPYADEREQELLELERAMANAKERERYSLGQFLMARMVRLLTGAHCLENVEVTGVENILTGSPLSYDLCLPQHNVALEFHGRQHDGPTELYPEYARQRLRDMVKLARSVEDQITLIVVRPENLSFHRLRELLTGKVPLRKNLDNQRHVCDLLDRVATNYRRKTPPRVSRTLQA